MTSELTSEVRAFRASWRRYAVPIALAASFVCVPLLDGLGRSTYPPHLKADTWLHLLSLLGAPLAAVAVIPTISVWVFLVRKIPWLDSRIGFVVSLPVWWSAIFVLGMLTIMFSGACLWVFIVFPMYVFLYAYPGIVVGLVLPRIVVPSLRPDNLRIALEADDYAPAPRSGLVVADAPPGRRLTSPMRVRKPVDELKADDLAVHPVWEFALDEEGEEGQDETTLRPVMTGGSLDPTAGSYIVAAAFTFADGSIADGFITPRPPGMEGPDGVQPVVLSPAGQVVFWHGLAKPDERELRSAYERLNLPPASVFPVRFASRVPLASGTLEGVIPGFGYLASIGAEGPSYIR